MEQKKKALKLKHTVENPGGGTFWTQSQGGTLFWVLFTLGPGYSVVDENFKVADIY